MPALGETPAAEELRDRHGSGADAVNNVQVGRIWERTRYVNT